MEITTIIVAANLALIAGLLIAYAKNLMRIKSAFTFGLFVFALLFFLQNLVVLYFSLTMMPYYSDGVRPYMVTLTILQTFAFALMNYITWR